MNILKFFTVMMASTLLLFGFTGSVFGDDVPRGTKGKDYDAKEVRIKRGGSTATIEGYCESKGPFGSRPTIASIIYIDGRRTKVSDVFGSSVTATTFIKGRGRYHVILQCENAQAEQYKAKLSITGSDVVIIRD